MSSADIGNRVKAVRGSLSQREFADRLKTSSGRISEVEGGKTVPGGDFLLRLHQEFKTDVTWLLTGNVSEPIEPGFSGQVRALKESTEAAINAGQPDARDAIYLARESNSIQVLISAREAKHLASFRAITEEGRRAVEDTCAAIENANHKKPSEAA